MPATLTGNVCYLSREVSTGGGLPQISGDCSRGALERRAGREHHREYNKPSRITLDAEYIPPDDTGKKGRLVPRLTE
jgi:hypothetical protein